MIYTGVVLLGIISWTKLPQELYPPIAYPQLTVVTRYKDAAPEEIEILVTKPIEEAVGTVPGLRRISSISKEEVSLVIAEFNWGSNMDLCALGVREKIDLIKERLPHGSEDSVVIKFNPFELPVLVLNFSGDLSPHDLLEVARRQIKNELEKVEGVAAVNISGGLEREILVEVDQGRMEASEMSISQVVDALGKTNLNYPGGTIKEAFYEYLIRTMGEFKIVPEIPSVPIAIDEDKGHRLPQRNRNQDEKTPSPLKREKGVPPPQRLILLKDVAVVKDIFKEKTSISRFNGVENISITIQKQAGANIVQVATRIKESMKRIQPTLPPGVHLKTVYDQSIFIQQAISGVLNAATEGGFLAFIVLFIFLGNFWAALNVTFAIPISAFATIAPMYFSGITINVISMGGLALAMGMLVDAGTVAVENIDLKRKEGRPSAEAAVEGTQEIASALFGTINTTVVVFLPTVFVIGIAGQLFKQLTYTVVISHYTSLAVALTLTPLFASRIRYNTGRSPIEPVVDAIRRFDTALVTWFLRHRVLGIGVITALFLGSLFAFTLLDRETLPKVDQGQFVLRVGLPPGTRLEVTDRVTQRIERVLQAIPEVLDVSVAIGSSKDRKAEELLDALGSHQAQILVNLKLKHRGLGRSPPGQFRTRKTVDIVQELKKTLAREPLEGADVEFLLQESSFKSSFLGGAPVMIEVKGIDLNRMEKLADETSQLLSAIPGLYGVQTSIVPPSPETKVYVNKDRASVYHLTVSDIAQTAQTAFKGSVATKFKEEGKEYDVLVQLRKEDREDLNKVRRLLVHSPLDMNVPLSEVAHFYVGKGPTEIKRIDQQRTIFVSAQLFGRPLAKTLQEVNDRLEKMKVPSGYTVSLTGENRQMKESFESLAFALGLSVLLVYMVMASEFESLWQPFLIMGTIPMGIIGVVLALWITHTSVSIMTILGIIMLGGLVVDDGIVLVDYVNLMKSKGVPTEKAVVLASERRLRPILMTAGTTVLGLLPLALGFEEGAELQGPMAIAVMGGMTVCTFLTLFFLPTLYVTAENFLKRFHLVDITVSTAELTAPVMVASLDVAEVPLLPTSLVLQTGVLGPSSIESQVPYVGSDALPDVPEIPENFGGEEAVLEKPEMGIGFPGGFLEYPEPQVPSTEQRLPTIPDIPEIPEDFGGTEAVPEKSEPLVSETPLASMAKPEPDLPSQPAPLASGKSPAIPSLNPRQQQLMDYLATHGRITRKEFVQLTGISVPTAARDLKEMVDYGLIKGFGPLAKGRYYVLAKLEGPP